MSTPRSFNRRDFLSLFGAAAAGIASGVEFPRWAHATADSSWRLRISTSSLLFRSLSFEEMCQQASEIGFEAIDLWPATFGCTHLREIEEVLSAEKAKEILQHHRIQPFAITCYREGYSRHAKLLATLGGRIAIRESIYGAFEPADLVPGLKRLFASLAHDIELAEQYDAIITIENHGKALLNSLDSLKAFVEHNPSERLGIALAPAHLQAAGVSVERAIQTCGKQLKFFYAWQSGDGLDALPGLGAADFRPWIAALAKSGYEGYVNPFTHHEAPPKQMAAALTKSVAYLHDCQSKI